MAKFIPELFATILFTFAIVASAPSRQQEEDDLCTPSPCGPNAYCESRTLSAGRSAAACRCPEGYQTFPGGNTVDDGCVLEEEQEDLCSPTPCGPNTSCETRTLISGRSAAICRCLEEFDVVPGGNTVEDGCTSSKGSP